MKRWIVLTMVFLAAMLSAPLPAATVRWIGGAAAVAQVDTLTVGGTVEADDIFTITLTGENGDTWSEAVVAGATNVDTVAATIAAAFNAETYYLFTPITAAGVGSGGQLTLTADTAGVPFTCTVATTETGGGAADDQTFARAATTANSGPYDWNTSANWVRANANALPGANADDVVYVYDATIYYGLNQSAISEALDDLHIRNSQIGANPATGKAAPYLQIKSVDVYINEDFSPSTPSSASPIMVDTGATQAANIYVYASPTNSTAYLPAVWVKCNNSSSTLTIYDGIVGFAFSPSDSTSQVGAVTLHGGQLYTGAVSSWQSTFTMSGGTASLQGLAAIATATIAGGTCALELPVTTLHIAGGTITTNYTVTTMHVNGGTLSVGRAAAFTTINQHSGTIYYDSTGTITNLNVYGGTFDCTLKGAAHTITTPKIGPGGKIKYNPAKTTLTAPIAPISTTEVITLSAS